METLYPVSFYITALILVAIIFGWRASREFQRERDERAEERREYLIERATKEAQIIVEQARVEARAFAKEKRSDLALERENTLQALENTKEELITKLESAVSLSRDQAEEELRAQLLESAKHDVSKELARIETKLREDAKALAQEIISIALPRVSTSYGMHHLVSVVELDSEEMKGRIIGREGRNIRAFEKLTGVDVIVDESPETVIISSYHPIRREVARRALTRLLQDGKINPQTIQEAVVLAESALNDSMLEVGKRVLEELSLPSIKNDLMLLLGKTEYYQCGNESLLTHSKQVAGIAKYIAGELGVNSTAATKAGLFHDIGKVLDDGSEGSHAAVGARLLEKFEESSEIINAVKSHHEESTASGPLGMVLQAANHLARQKPGASREHYQDYIRRATELESLAIEFSGVHSAYALQAGRELYIHVQSESVSDESAILLAKEIAKKLEEEVTYSGQVKVTVVRELRAIEYAS